MSSSVLTLLVAVCVSVHTVSSAPQWRVVNGEEAVQHEYPSIVSMQMYGTRHFCAGTLLDSTTVVTAAHCTAAIARLGPSGLKIRAGEHNFNTKTGNEQQVDIVSWKNHENYNGQTSAGEDIALVKLATPLYESEYVKYATLPETEVTQAGDKCTVVGWGSTDAAGTKGAKILQKADLFVVSNELCGRYFFRVNTNGNKNICAYRGAERINACKGDSGGPLYCTSNGQQYLVGIVSYGRVPCAQPNIPAVFTRVSTYTSWINQNR